MIFPSGASIVTAAQMRAAEDAVFASGVSQDALMERAGAAVAREAARFAMGHRVLVVAGPGNNGGDAYVCARYLKASGHDVIVAALGAPKAGSAAAMRARWDGPVVPFAEAQPRAMLVDGLFGTGMTRALDSEVADKLQALVRAASFTLSIDLPSGIGTDDATDFGAPRGIGATLALGALKPAHVLAGGIERSGHVLRADIGIPVPGAWRSVRRPKLAAPSIMSHKYSRGMVAVLGGAMPGAARLAARAALAGGAGYVLLGEEGAGEGGPDALVRRRLPDTPTVTALLAEPRVSVAVVGPGLGREARARTLLDSALASDLPLVIDGDALWLLAGQLDRLRGRRELFLTPHEGEFVRLFGAGSGNKIERTVAAARTSGATVLHKGPDTVLAAPSGDVRVLSGASPWLSTAGTGDVLAGTLAARIATDRTAAPLDIAEAAAWLHARAADHAGAAFAADELIAHLPTALTECL